MAFFVPPYYIKTCKEDKTHDYAEYIGYTRQSVSSLYNNVTRISMELRGW